MDAPATQAWKRERLREEGIVAPPHLTYVPVDFEHQPLPTRLAESGLDLDTPTLFAWLGVTPYLTPEAIFSTLRFIASATTRGGGVVFDYSLPPETLPFLQRVAYAALAARVAAAGEPFRTSFVPERLIEQLRAMGFDDIENASG